MHIIFVISAENAYDLRALYICNVSRILHHISFGRSFGASGAFTQLYPLLLTVFASRHRIETYVSFSLLILLFYFLSVSIYDFSIHVFDVDVGMSIIMF